jgi:hypothetical protein
MNFVLNMKLNNAELTLSFSVSDIRVVFGFFMAAKVCENGSSSLVVVRLLAPPPLLLSRLPLDFPPLSFFLR